jgi:RNAse (barnase) inhibitor barstar
MDRRVYTLDGTRFSTLEEFYDEVERVLIPGARWGRNLDAFNDILYGGFGTPSEGFTLIWEYSAESRARLGYQETVRRLEIRLERCHPASMSGVARALMAEGRHEGPTVFDWLVDIIREHRNVDLRLA